MSSCPSRARSGAASRLGSSCRWPWRSTSPSRRSIRAVACSAPPQRSLLGRVAARRVDPAPAPSGPALRERAARKLVGGVEVLDRVRVIAPARVELGERQRDVHHGAPLEVLAALDDCVWRSGHLEGRGHVGGRESPPSRAGRNRRAASMWTRGANVRRRRRFPCGRPARPADKGALTCRDVIARDDALAALEAEPFDLVVIGGGITGAGVALDAASRGYSVALVERDDYASGTSSRSSKLVHGGLRYLQNFDLGLVREALLERALLVNLAPHLVRPLELLVASFEGKHPQRTVGVGLNMYDAMATERLRLPGRRRRDGDGIEEWSPDRHRVIEGEEVKRLLPALAGRDPTAAYLFYDCQTD